ncbi:SAC3 family protein [Vairimorpha necatrix]|uniref:SAC3 family protein n=1 Tax=Vairimorpha necatrix TaxID=6039 RepID=A0AAX4JG86_9MICR
MNLEYIYRDLLQKREEKPEYSGYIERTLRGDVNKYERDILVKKYNRSSAGKSKAFPEDVRPISVLTSVLDYLLQFCDFSLESYKFLENRTRSIRLDISIQELECDRTIMILEKICRLLILYNYALYDNKEFEEYLNIEQIKKILGTLKELYNNKNKQGLSNNTHRSKNYQEFMGYYKLITFDDVLNTSDLSLTSKLSLFDNIKMAYTQNNLYRFFLLSRSTDFLSFCLLHTYYDKLRLKGIEIYSKCFIEKIDSSLINKLLFLSERELISLCNKTNIQLTQTSTTTSKEDRY